MEANEKGLTSGPDNVELQADITLGEQIMVYVPRKERFTGQVTVEVHCKNGKIKDIYLSARNKLFSSIKK